MPIGCEVFWMAWQIKQLPEMMKYGSKAIKDFVWVKLLGSMIGCQCNSGFSLIGLMMDFPTL